MVSFGDSKNEPIKPLQSLFGVTPLKLALSAKCTIHDVMPSPFIFVINSFINLSCVGLVALLQFLALTLACAKLQMCHQ